VLGGCLHEEGSGEEEKGNSASAWQLRGDKDVVRTWRRRLHGLHVEQRWRAADSAGARWRAVTEPPWCHRVCVGARWPGHVAIGHRGPLASGPCH
jgi:hypothetical protein